MKFPIGYALILFTVVMAVPGRVNAENIICSNCGENVETGTGFCPYCDFGLGDIRQIRPEEVEYVNKAINRGYDDPPEESSEPGYTKEEVSGSED